MNQYEHFGIGKIRKTINYHKLLDVSNAQVTNFIMP